MATMTSHSSRPTLGSRAALLVIDVQKAFAEVSYWGQRNNPECEANIARLLHTWRDMKRPIVFVRHDSTDPNSPLHPDHSGNAFQEIVTGEPDLLVTKSVNSSFHGSPDLHAWLRDNDIQQVVVCGITTNHCCETTARVGGNLGYDVFFALDATHTFDRSTVDGDTLSADTLARVTGANLHGEFATVVKTADLAASRNNALNDDQGLYSRKGQDGEPHARGWRPAPFSRKARMTMAHLHTVEDYLRSFPPDIAQRLGQLREISRTFAPDATEGLKWGHPAYSLGVILFVFSGHKHHSNMVFTPSTKEAFADQLTDFTTGKGSVQIPHSQPVPTDLLGDMISYRIREFTENGVMWK